jgi:Tfp pilus assembly protein PilF
LELTHKSELTAAAGTTPGESAMNSKLGLRPKISTDPVAIEIRRVGGLIEGNDLAEAEAQALRLLKAHPQRADVHNILGVAYTLQKKEKQAVPHFEFAVRAEPGNSHFLNNLGRLYVDLEFIELALPFLHKALAINPKLASALLAIGKYYNRIGKAQLALPYFERLRQVVPQNDDAKYELAESLDTLGRREEANQLYRELQATESYAVSAVYYFSRSGPPSGNIAVLAEIEKLLSRETLSDPQRSRLHTALGFIHEKERNYRLAFSHFDRANRLRPITFDLDQYRAWVDDVIAKFTVTFFRERADVGSPSSVPVLVVGMPRSGTTLTEQIIASHRQTGGAGELSRIGLFADRFSFRRDAGKFIASFDSQDGKAIREMADNYVDLLKFHAPKAERVVDKLPHNFENLGFAALLLPNARIIHCSRNPVDTCWSCFENPLNDAHSYSRDLTRLGLYYREYKRLMDHWKAVLPMPIYELSYERLTTDFENEARKVIDFIGLPWDEACLNFHDAGRTVLTFSRQQVRSPIYRSSVERWRNYETELQPLISALGDLV